MCTLAIKFIFTYILALSVARTAPTPNFVPYQQEIEKIDSQEYLSTGTDCICTFDPEELVVIDPMYFSDDEDTEICIDLCMTLASEGSEQGPQIVCSILSQYGRLQTSADGLTSSLTEWSFTGVTTQYVCCDKSEAVMCIL